MGCLLNGGSDTLSVSVFIYICQVNSCFFLNFILLDTFIDEYEKGVNLSMLLWSENFSFRNIMSTLSMVHDISLIKASENN